jgi:tRNA uridine 5-carboxymethylaminomethyl modification enzyme
VQRLGSTWIKPQTISSQDANRVLGQDIEREYALTDLLRRPQVTYAALMTLPGAAPAQPLAPEVAQQVEVAVKYAGYIERQRDEVARQAGQADTPLPPTLDYRSVRGLSIEVQQRLNQHKPETIGQASRVQGVTPAAIALLLVHLKRGFKPEAARAMAGGAS